MVMFDRKEGEFPPLLYNIGDKIMGFHTSIGGQMLVGGEIIERTQSTSYLDENQYKVKLESDLLGDGENNKDQTWWINEKEAKPFKQDVWKRAVKHWLVHGTLQSKSYMEYLRMHRALREEPDDISDEQLQIELDKKHNPKKEKEQKEEKK